MPVSRRFRRHAVARTAIILAALAAAPVARAGAPMAYTAGYGTRNYGVVTLLWALLIVSLLVVAIVTVLLVAGIARRRGQPRATEPAEVPVERPDHGLSWIYVGTAISAVVLVAAALWTFSTLAAVSAVPPNAAVKVEIIGHQWWWEVRYDSSDHSRIFTTANEIHIPVGEPVSVGLTSTDVIHSFWVPELTGKTDTIPGQHNVSWIEADKAGTYRGQCGEYCGLQHAHMAMSVIAEPSAQFEAWWKAQLEAPAPPRSQQVARGETNFVAHCGICHSVRGTKAGGALGPDLSHLMTRRTIAAGTAPNEPGYLAAWIADPQHLKPGNLMPILDLSGPQLADIEAYVETLK
ncbi:MAG TPA: cytochrome c oxidase subunit II [Stellaceae bacterium]|jgi:cytochrome c oxidase subunit 2|nr:cytochrome c oxidase subunit II [Stellaceae bacterium]